MYFRQLVPGKDICVPKTARDAVQDLVFSASYQLANYVYLVGCSRSKTCFVVDGCWDSESIERIAREDGQKIVGAIATHVHFDHVGGKLPSPYDGLGVKIPGLLELARNEGVHREAYIHESELKQAVRQTGLKETELRPLVDGSTLSVGSVHLKFIHTPGHSRGSMCVLVEGEGDEDQGKETFLLSGDTIFPGSHGRVDLAESDPAAMKESLRRLAENLEDDTRVYPGHSYGGPFTTLGREKAGGVLSEFSRKGPQSRL